MGQSSVTKVGHRFGEYLINRGYLTSEKLDKALEEQKGTRQKLGEVLVRRGYITEKVFAQTSSEYLGVPLVSLNQVEIEPNAVQLVSEELARRYTLIPVNFERGALRVAMSDPSDMRALEDVRIYTGFEIRPFLSQGEEIRAAIRQYLTLGNTLAQLSSYSGDEVSGSWDGDYSDAENLGTDNPTIRLVDSLLYQAIEQGASDIHWEPGENTFVVRYRLDGQLVLKCRISPNAARTVISRLKVMAKLDVSERRLPQDGRMAVDNGKRKIDLRVSSLPTVYGEKIVVRILNSETAQRSLDALGMRIEVKNGILDLLHRPHGLILVVGPTGSGKTTTIYALLRELNANHLNIVSIEDPVEYRLSGVNQVQVNSAIGLDFARGLRSILRQDPDVIMIGEIRDEETARIAAAAALTGHLVLSTLHTNTAAEALTRLLDMGIEPYLLASAVSGVLSQRLVRVLCEHCKEPYQVTQSEKTALLLPDETDFLFHAKGCKHCGETGYQGRVGIHELLLYNQRIKEIVLNRQSSTEIESTAIESGMIPLIHDGILKAAKGLTSVEEIYRSSIKVI